MSVGGGSLAFVEGQFLNGGLCPSFRVFRIWRCVYKLRRNTVALFQNAVEAI